MKTTLYLDGKKAYIRRCGIASSYVTKSDFQSLIKNIDTELDMIVLNNSARFYENKMRALGYNVIDLIRYDIFSVKIIFALA